MNNWLFDIANPDITGRRGGLPIIPVIVIVFFTSLAALIVLLILKKKHDGRSDS